MGINLYELIKSVYPNIDEKIKSEHIILRNDLNSKGDYISKWECDIELPNELKDYYYPLSILND